MSRVVVDTKTIYPLLAMPISEAESTLVAAEGPSALTSRLEEMDTDVSDWDRECVVTGATS